MSPVEWANLLTLIWVGGGILGYVVGIIFLFVNPHTDEYDWGWLGIGIIVGILWPAILVIGLIFGAIPEGCKALHAWIHRPKPLPEPVAPPSSAIVPPQADKLTTVKA